MLYFRNNIKNVNIVHSAGIGLYNAGILIELSFFFLDKLFDFLSDEDT